MTIAGQGYVGLAKEGAFGVAAAPTIFIPVKSAEATTDPQNYYPEEIRSSRMQGKSIQMANKHELTLALDCEPANLGHILLGALGSVQTTDLGGAAPTAYQHVFTPANTLPSYTVEKYDGVMTQRIAGAKIDTLTLSVEAGGDGVLGAEVSMFAQSIADQGAAATPNYVDKTPFAFNSVAVQKGGANNANLRSFDLEISNALKDDHYVLGTSKDVSAIPEGFMEITGSAEMYFTNKAEYLAFMAGDTDSLKLTFTGATISGVNKETLTIELPKIAYDAFEVPMGGPDEEILASMEFTALYESTLATAIKATLISAVAAY